MLNQMTEFPHLMQMSNEKLQVELNESEILLESRDEDISGEAEIYIEAIKDEMLTRELEGLGARCCTSESPSLRVKFEEEMKNLGWKLTRLSGVKIWS